MTKYERYLLSPEWKKKADQRRRIDKYSCQMCGNWDEHLEIHHLSYVRIYNEDVFKDLVSLCPTCHELVHKMMRRQVDEYGDRGWSFLQRLHKD